MLYVCHEVTVEEIKSQVLILEDKETSINEKKRLGMNYRNYLLIDASTVYGI